MANLMCVAALNSIKGDVFDAFLKSRFFEQFKTSICAPDEECDFTRSQVLPHTEWVFGITYVGSQLDGKELLRIYYKEPKVFAELIFTEDTPIYLTGCNGGVQGLLEHMKDHL